MKVNLTKVQKNNSGENLHGINVDKSAHQMIKEARELLKANGVKIANRKTSNRALFELGAEMVNAEVKKALAIMTEPAEVIQMTEAQVGDFGDE